MQVTRIQATFACVAFFNIHGDLHSSATETVRKPPDSQSVERSLHETDEDIWRTHERCGINATYVFLLLHGSDITYADVLRGISVHPGGVRLDEIQRFCSAHQVASKTVALTPETISQANFPIIAHLEPQVSRGHYVVLLSFNRQLVEFVDGTSGAIQVLPTAEFFNQWTGYAVVSTRHAVNRALAGVGIFALGLLLCFFAKRTFHRRTTSRISKPSMVSPFSSSSLWFLGFIALSCGSAIAQEPTQLKEIQEIYEAQTALVDSLYVKYRAESMLNGSPEDAFEFLQIVHLRRDIEEYAFKGNQRYFSVRRSEDDSDVSVVQKSFQNGEDLMIPANRVVAYDGKLLRTRGSGGETATIGTGDKDFDDTGYFDPTYLGLVFKVLPDAINLDNRREENRLDGVIRLGMASRRSNTEIVDGTPCVAIDVTGPVHMTHWCDPKKQFAVVKQVGYYPGSQELMWSTVNRNFVEVVDKTWFPMKSVTERFPGPTAPPNKVSTPLVTYTYDVIELHANDVPDELFSLNIPPGTLVHDFDAEKSGTGLNSSFYMPADGKTLEQTIIDIRESQSKPILTTNSYRLLASLAALASICLGFFLINRKK